MKTNEENKKNKPFEQENEELREQIQEQFGGNSWINPDADLPPELENDFLKHIIEFEKAMQNRKTITVHDFLGKPEFKKIEELSDDEISTELQKLYEVMKNNEMKLSTLCEVSDRELYRFITEELFWEEKDDIRIPGMTSHFTYEEFHPNHEHDIRRQSEDFFSSYLDKSSDFYTYSLSTDAEKKQWHKDFRNTFSKFELINFEIIDLRYDLESADAQVRFDCDIKATVEGSGDIFRINGEGELILLYQWDAWSVDSVEFPKPDLSK